MIKRIPIAKSLNGEIIYIESVDDDISHIVVTGKRKNDKEDSARKPV